MDAVKLTKEDHKTVEGLFKKYRQAGPRAYKTKERLAQRIIKELSVHADIEEKILYPKTRQIRGDTDDMVREALQEHQQAKAVLRQIQSMTPQDERFDQKMNELIDDVLHHAKEEERDMLPKLREALSRQELEELGERMKEAKKKAPTRA